MILVCSNYSVWLLPAEVKLLMLWNLRCVFTNKQNSCFDEGHGKWVMPRTMRPGGNTWGGGRGLCSLYPFKLLNLGGESFGTVPRFQSFQVMWQWWRVAAGFSVKL